MISRNRHIAKARIKAPGAGASTFELTKIDVAEAEICTAVRLFFDDCHPVPIYMLASAAREILTTIATKAGIESVLHELADAEGAALKDAIQSSHQWANFFKHADRDPTDRIQFSETEVDSVLYTACNDFQRVTGGMPIEAQVFCFWIRALAYERVSEAPLREQEDIKWAISQFPGIRRVGRKDQKRLGLDVLSRVKRDPELQLPHKREVIISNTPKST
jgi:hypothetical protein